MATTPATPSPLTAVRFKLGADEAAPQPDPLGRARIGYAEGLSPAELWERGRGVWKAKLATVAECDMVILAHNGVVVLVGTVDGVRFAGDRIAVTGAPDPTHPLIGQPDPLDNASRNPVTYGEIHTVRPAPTQRPYAAVLADAIRILTEAARLRRPTMRVTENGMNVEPDPYFTELDDFPEFVTLALAGTAANVGGVYNVLAGRPGSWEAAGVESLLDSTVGPEGTDLWRHRTEPIHLTVHVPAVMALHDVGTDFSALEDEIDEQEAAEDEALNAELMDDALYWTYDFSKPGEPVPLSPDTPAWSWEAYRAELGIAYDEKTIAKFEAWIRGDGEAPYWGLERTIISLPRNEAARETIAALKARQEESTQKFERLREELTQRQRREWADYGAALRPLLEREIAALQGLNVPVEITIDATTEEYDTRYDHYTLEAKLIENAAARLNKSEVSRG